VLKLYSKTSYQQLYRHLLAIVDNKTSLFSKTWIVIPNHSAKQWLQKSLARDRGVCSQIEFILPLSFHWQVLKNVKQTQFDFNLFSSDVLSWKIYHFISNKSKYQFLQQDNALSNFNLAQRIAQTFLKYNEERPETIAAWDEGIFQLAKEHKWQADMWLDLLDDLNELSPVQLLNKFNPQRDFTESPDAIILFATEQLTVLQTSTLYKLSKLHDIHLMLSNPCPDFYWYDLQELKVQQRKELFDQEDIIDIGHPLLASLGRNKMALFDAFIEDCETQQDDFELQAQAQTLLQSVKSDILNLNEQPEPFKTDASIEIFACHNRFREVEIIKDSIMHQLQSDASLKPEEIIVVASDINVYVDAIRATFEYDSNNNNSHYIPFHIDRVRLVDHQYVINFIHLLQSFSREMSANNIYDLLSHSLVLQKFNLTDEDLPRIKNWIINSNIRKFYSASHKQQLGYPKKAGNTWQFGENRWISGYLAGDSLDTPYLSSFGDFSGQEQLFSQLFSFLQVWFKYYKLLQNEYSPQQWYSLIQELCKSFLYNDKQEDLEATILKQLHSKLVQKTLNVSDELPLQVIVDIVNNVISESNYRSEGQIGIRFQTWENAFIVDAKMLIIMGLNDGEFPQQEIKNDIDIFNNKLPRLNKSSRQRDKNLLLTALTESTEKLVFSYIGFNAKTNDRQPPSVLLAELYSYLQVKTAHKFSIVEHKMHGFNHVYYQDSGTVQNSYNLKHYQFAQCFYSAKNKAAKAHINLQQQSEKRIPLAQLQLFFKDPLNYFLKIHAQINNSLYADILKDEECYYPDALEQWQLNNEIFYHGKDSAKKTGIIADTSLGELQLQHYQRSLQALLDKQTELKIKQKTVELDSIALFGTLDIDDSQQLTSIYPSKASSKYIAEHWIKHLCYSSDKCSYIYFKDKNFEVKPLNNYAEIINLIVQKWRQCYSQPWLFLPSASFKILSYGLKINTSKEYISKFSKTNNFPSEGQLYFIDQIKKYDQEEEIKSLIEPMIEHVSVLK